MTSASLYRPGRKAASRRFEKLVRTYRPPGLPSGDGPPSWTPLPTDCEVYRKPKSRVPAQTAHAESVEASVAQLLECGVRLWVRGGIGDARRRGVSPVRGSTLLRSELPARRGSQLTSWLANPEQGRGQRLSRPGHTLACVSGDRRSCAPRSVRNIRRWLASRPARSCHPLPPSGYHLPPPPGGGGQRTYSSFTPRCHSTRQLPTQTERTPSRSSNHFPPPELSGERNRQQPPARHSAEQRGKLRQPPAPAIESALCPGSPPRVATAAR